MWYSRQKKGHFVRKAEWTPNLQRLKAYLEEHPLENPGLHTTATIQHLREYAKKHGLPAPKPKDISKLARMTKHPVNFDQLVADHPEVLEDYKKYTQTQQDFLASLPENDRPYYEIAFRNNISDMIDHKEAYRGADSTLGRLKTVFRYLAQKRGEKYPYPNEPDYPQWHSYDEQLLKPYRGFHKQDFIDWDKYFEDNPEIKEYYDEYLQQIEPFKQSGELSRFSDPRDYMGYTPEKGQKAKNWVRTDTPAPAPKYPEQMPQYDSYVDYSNAPMGYQDLSDYLWSLPEEHKEKLMPYFWSQASETEYGDDEETYGMLDDVTPGDAAAHVSPQGYDKGWMIHFTPHAEDIAQQGFTRGVTLEDARNLTQTEGGSGTAGFNYAFSTDHPNPSWQGGKAVVFPGHNLKVHHGRNQDDYVVFDGTSISPENIFPIVSETWKDEDGRTNYGWSVYALNGRKMISRKPIKEVMKWIEENHGMLQDIRKKVQSDTS